MLEYAGEGINSDFKYIMFDLSTIFIGARYTYQDLVENESVSFKLQTILHRYLLTEVTPETTLESHFYYLKPEDFAYQVYEQLKTRVRVSVPEDKKGFGGRTERVYKERTMKLCELAALSPSEKKERGILIREIQISKLGLLGFSV